MAGPLVAVIPPVVLAAAGELDNLADRLTTAGTTCVAPTHVAPAGAEEVSLLSAEHFNRLAAVHETVLSDAVAKLRQAALVLRAQAGSYVVADAGNADAVGHIAS